jgi:hypothetical protein
MTASNIKIPDDWIALFVKIVYILYTNDYKKYTK